MPNSSTPNQIITSTLGLRQDFIFNDQRALAIFEHNSTGDHCNLNVIGACGLR